LLIWDSEYICLLKSRIRLADVGAKILNFLAKDGFRARDLSRIEPDACTPRKSGLKIGERFARMLRKFQNGCPNRAPRRESRAKDNEEDGQREQLVRFRGEIGDTIADGRIDDRLSAEGVRNRLSIALEQELIDAIVLVKHPKRRLQALRQTVDGWSVEAFVIDALEFEHDSNFA
jgi:hypothetical protein